MSRTLLRSAALLAMTLVLTLACTADDKPTPKPSALDRLPGQPGGVVASLSGHRGFVEAVAFSPDGKWLASSDSYGSVLLWDVGDFKDPTVLKKPTNVHPALWDDTGHVFRQLAFSPDSKLLVGGGSYVQLWDLTGARPIEKTRIELPKNSRAWSLDFLPDSKTLATNADPIAAQAASQWTVCQWDLAPDKPIELSRLGELRPFAQFAFSPDGKSLVCVSWTEGPRQGAFRFPMDVVTIWDVGTRKERARIEGFKTSVNHVAYSPDGHTLAVAMDDDGSKETLRLFDIRGDKSKQVAVLAGHEKGVRFTAFLPGGKHLVSAGTDGHIIIWDISPGKLLVEQEWKSATPASVMHVASAPDGRHLAIACRHNTVQIMRIR